MADPAARLAPERDYLALKAAWRDLVQMCGGPVRAARLTRGCQSRISEAMAADHPGRFPALDQVLDLELDCGQPVVSALLADLSGCDTVRRPAGAALPMHSHFARIVTGCGGLEAVLALALADQTIDTAERTRLAAAANLALEQLQAFKSSLLSRPPRSEPGG
jgi:hypothetical protein